LFLKNCWYVAAWDHELDDGFLAHTILGEPVVLFRSSDGAAVALENRCCHRHLPLSEGRLVGDTLECGYHGLAFGFDGKCVNVPGRAAIPSDARVRSYPVIERYRWIWIWMGDPALADAAAIPDYHWNDDPEWLAYGDVYYVKDDCRLLIDNLMDLSHIQFLHASTLGASSDVDAMISLDRYEDNVKISCGCSIRRRLRSMPRHWGPTVPSIAGRTSHSPRHPMWRSQPGRRDLFKPHADARNQPIDPLFLASRAQFSHGRRCLHRSAVRHVLKRLAGRRGRDRGAATRYEPDAQRA